MNRRSMKHPFILYGVQSVVNPVGGAGASRLFWETFYRDYTWKIFRKVLSWNE